MSILDLIENLGKKESDLTNHEVISPVFNNRKIVTRLSGVTYQFQIPYTKPGWYSFKPVDFHNARVSREANMGEIDSYLRKLQRVYLILFQREKNCWLGVPATRAPIDLQEVYQVLLPNDSADVFDHVVGRFDGCRIWFHDLNTRVDLTLTEYLKMELEKGTGVNKLHYKGLSFAEKSAYAIKLQLEEKKKVRSVKDRLKDAVEHGGGEFVSYKERSDHFSVTYNVDGRKYTSFVQKNDGFGVLSAGICLSGGDRNFDLKSLIPVLKEGHRTNAYFEVFNLDGDDD